MKKTVYAALAILCVLAIIFGISFVQARGNVTRLTEEIKTLNETVVVKDTEIESLTTESADKGSEIEALTADVESKAGEIETLTAGVADRDAQIESLTADVADRDAQIETLTADVDNKAGEIETLTADVAGKAEEIETLTASIADKDTQIESLTADVADRDAQIETLTTDVESKAGEIETLQSQVQQKDTEIEELSADIERYQKAGTTAPAVPEDVPGTYTATKYFIKALKDHDIKYTYHGLNQSDNDRITSRWTIAGRTVELTIIIPPTEDIFNIYAWNLIDFDPSNRSAVLQACNEENFNWKFTCFYVDDNDNSVTVSANMPLSESQDTGTAGYDLFDRFLSILEDALPNFIPFAVE